MASHKAASTCRGAKSAAEDAWLLLGNGGPIIDPVLWKRMFKGIEIYKGRSFAEKIAVMPSQVRAKIQYMVTRGEHLTVTGASIILAELCGVLLGLRHSNILHLLRGSPTRQHYYVFVTLREPHRTWVT